MEVCFPKDNTPPWMFFKFFKLQKWHQILQRITYALGGKLGIGKNMAKVNSLNLLKLEKTI